MGLRWSRLELGRSDVPALTDVLIHWSPRGVLNSSELQKWNCIRCRSSIRSGWRTFCSGSTQLWVRHDHATTRPVLVRAEAPPAVQSHGHSSGDANGGRHLVVNNGEERQAALAWETQKLGDWANPRRKDSFTAVGLRSVLFFRLQYPHWFSIERAI